jgi:ubiquitin carboxyl-terminal hydrolase 25/28
MGEDAKSDTSSTVAELDPDDDHQMDLSGSTQEEKPEEVNKSIDATKPEPPSRPPPVPPRPQDMKKIEGLAEQQDAAEILNNVFDLLSCAFKGDGTLRDGEQDDLIKRLFFNDVTAVLNSNGKVTLKTDLQDNYLVSPGERSRPLYSALDDEFSLKEIEGDSSKTKWEFIAHVAPIQIFNVRRLVFDSKEKRSRKDESHVGLDDVLYLDRYMEHTKSRSKEDLLRLREEQWQLQRILKALESRKTQLKETEVKADLSDALEETAAFIEDVNKINDENLIDVDDDPMPPLIALPDELRGKARELEKEAEILDGRMKEIDSQIDTIFQDCKDHPYRLHAVFMHRGSSTGGHYWIYIYDSQNKIWRNYNDERVEEAEVKNVFEQEGRATSTGVVFVQEDRVAELTEAVHRKPDVPSAPEDDDVDMKDADPNELQVIDGIEKE